MKVDGTFRVVPAVVILDWFDDVGENTQRGNIRRSGHAMQHVHASRLVRQAEPFEIEADGVETRVHRRDVGRVLR